MHETEAFREHLRSKGLRYTAEREAVLRAVVARKSHFDLEDIFADLRGKGVKVSRASIYRTLPLLLQSGLVEEVERTDKHAHYEHTYGNKHHDHMLCNSCGQVIEFYSPALEKLQDALCRSRGFRGASHTLEIRGLCRECRRKDPA